ncbi:MAG: exosortase/archaeosortase family protein [Verrucomicrobia bacterium]|nr:MAG: exosortase/archaeosortase family protein [Verrucomicrobiota bacterium]
MNESQTINEPLGFTDEVRRFWRRIPEKGFFFPLMLAWLALFQFLGNSTLGYENTPSLFKLMYIFYSKKNDFSDDSHGLFIPFVVLALLWWKRAELLSVKTRLWWPGLAIVAGSVCLHVLGYLVQQPRLSVVAVFTGIYGLMGLAWGPQLLRAIFFPFLLFVFMVPLGSLAEFVTVPLRHAVTRLVVFIAHDLVGINLAANGTALVKLPSGYQYEVAAACSGIRSLIAVSAIALIYGFTCFNGFWRRAVLLASAFPLAVLGNTFRMLVIVEEAERAGQEAGVRAHDSAFWSMLPYVPAIFGLLWLGRWLGEKRAGPGANSGAQLNPGNSPA